MLLRRRRILGLAIEERSLLLAETQAGGRTPELRCTAEFPLPEGISLQDPQRLGHALGEFLRANHFSAKEAVIGVPARWLLSREKTFPPAGPNALIGMARLEAERSFATGLEQLILDYANGAGAPSGRPLLLTAIARVRAEQALTMAKEAGLKPMALLPTVMALSTTLRPQTASGMVLLLGPNQAELLLRIDGEFRAIRHLPLTTPPPAEGVELSAWSRELNDSVGRMAGLMPQRAEGAEPLPLAIFNGAALPASALQGIGEPFGLRPEIRGALGKTNGRMQDAAAALALLGARNDSIPMDFLHSHLEVRRGGRSKRQVAWMAALAGAALVAGGLYLADWRAEQREVEALQSQLAQMKPDIEDARAVVQQARMARGWTDRRPSFLDPLRELTLAFPTEGRIWVTSLGIHQDMRVVVTGKASDEGTVLSLLDRVKGKPAFSGVKMQYRRDAGANSREVSFNLSFAFMNKE